MKKIVQKYRFSKFRRFTNGLMFAIISVIALTLCLIDISDHSASMTEIILPFATAVISMLMGFLTMFREDPA
jgi:hypothetical protein